MFTDAELRGPTCWHLYQHNTNEDVRYWVHEGSDGTPFEVGYEDEQGNVEHVVTIRSPRNKAQEPDVYAWPANRSVPSGFMPYDGFMKFYTRVSND